MTIQAAVYLRVSTEEQATDGYGLDAQRERCGAMATVKGWPIVAEYADEGISGSKELMERPGGAALLDAACNGEIGAVIFSSLDRLGRETILTLQAVDDLASCGVDIVSCKETFDTSTPTGKAMLGMVAVFAQLERDTITQRLTDGRNARGKIDGERGGRLPYGYVRVKTNGKSAIKIYPEKADIVRRIFSERQSGMTLQAIADGLNDERIPSPRNATWYPSSIKSVLGNYAAYAGDNRGQSKQSWPVILDRAV